MFVCTGVEALKCENRIKKKCSTRDYFGGIHLVLQLPDNKL